MKSNTLITLLVVAVLASTGAIGCRKKPSRLTNIPGQTGRVPDEGPSGAKPGLGPGSGIDTAPNMNPGGIGTATLDPNMQGVGPSGKDFSNYTADAARFAAETVYFDFDKSNIKPSELPKIRAVFDAMKSMPTKAVRVEGHTDNRGTEEYNRALGERRALSVREELIKMGMNPEMVPTISYGEDKPVDPANNEAAWAKNRRADFILLSPPGAP
jgi:peptidoglycan-associated lipoprotein